MKNEKFMGYHITDTINFKDIKKNGFTNKHNDKHYLGQGIYFYDSFDIAKLNIENNQLSYGETKDKVIIECVLSASEDTVLDLDDVHQLNKFREFWKKLNYELQNNGVCLEFETKKDFTKNNHLYYRCYALDLYKEQNNYKIVLRTFPNDNPQYGVDITLFKFSGIPYLEKYICVSDNSCISDIKIAYRNTTEEVIYI